MSFTDRTTNLTGHRMSKLQATLSASSAGTPCAAPAVAHHPITCTGELRYLDDGSFACVHATIPPGDLRTKLCIDHSIALLLIELSHDL